MARLLIDDHASMTTNNETRGGLSFRPFGKTRGRDAHGGAGDAGAPSREETRREHVRLAGGLLPFLWPEGRPDLRRHVVLAAIAMVAAKIVTVLVPVFYKEATDALTEGG